MKMQQNTKIQKKFLDIPFVKGQQEVVDFGFAIKKQKLTSTLFSKGQRTHNFFTEDSKLYITPREQILLKSGATLNRKLHSWDNISSRVVTKFVQYKPSETSLLLEALKRRYEIFDESTIELAKSFSSRFTLVRLWNASIVGSILFGMVLMTFVYRYLGQGASAADVVSQQEIIQDASVSIANTEYDAEAFAQQFAQIQQIESKQSLEAEIMSMVKGYPIEKMVPYIAEKDRTVAAFIVAIARKESGWGVHVPVLNGQDCYNYWGYRGQRELMGTGGHTCFNSTEDAVDTVAKRIETLVEEYGRNTPEEMVVWKCGNSCEATGGQAAANKWISDVAMYFDELNTQE